MPDFPFRLRMLRQRSKLTQRQLAAKVGIGATTISEYERGKNDPTLVMICSLADFFGVTTDYLLGRSEKR